LQEAQTRAQAAARGVSTQAELFRKRRDEQNERIEKFGILGQKVRELNAAISEAGLARGNRLTDEEHGRLQSSVPVLEAQLASLIDELQDLRQSARSARMRTLERNAESLADTLQALHRKLQQWSS
jgi:hypothetical protein